MPLVVPLLRLFMLFLNVYETFKTLKPPPLSSRNTGLPSVRATAQRKRAMKGCLAVWIVWCCLVAYERSVERIVGIFIPFYDELKTLSILFLMVTRAKSAEPIYLHVIRPLLKPYAATLDLVMDVTHAFGEFLLLFTTVPTRLVWSWWKRKFPTIEESLASEDEQRGTDTSHQDVTRLREAGSNSTGRDTDFMARPHRYSDRRAASASLSNLPKRPANKTRHASAESATSNFRGYGARSAFVVRPTTAANQATLVRAGRSQIYPELSPQPALATSPLVASDQQTPAAGIALDSPPEILSPPSDSSLQEEAAKVDEWRQYPAFPSAYPPTPLPLSQRLAISREHSTDPTALEGVAEEPQPSTRSSLPPREPLPLGFISASSDEDDVQTAPNPALLAQYQDLEATLRANVSMDDEENEADEEDDDDDDGFNVTLRTPLPPYGSQRNRRAQSLEELSAGSASESESSAPSRSTALTTADCASPTRARTVSESSASMSISDSSVAAGQKRAFSASSAAYSTVRGMKPKPKKLEGFPPRTYHHLRPKASQTATRRQPLRGLNADSPPEEDRNETTSDGVVANHEVMEPTVKRRRVQTSMRQRPLGGPNRNRSSSQASKTEEDLGAGPSRRVTRSKGKPSASRVKASAPSRPSGSTRQARAPSTDGS